jgi:hypothetical protein
VIGYGPRIWTVYILPCYNLGLSGLGEEAKRNPHTDNLAKKRTSSLSQVVGFSRPSLGMLTKQDKRGRKRVTPAKLRFFCKKKKVKMKWHGQSVIF